MTPRQAIHKRSWQTQQARLLFGEDPGDGAAVVSRPGSLMGDPIAPEGNPAEGKAKESAESPSSRASRVPAESPAAESAPEKLFGGHSSWCPGLHGQNAGGGEEIPGKDGG